MAQQIDLLFFRIEEFPDDVRLCAKYVVVSPLG